MQYPSFPVLTLLILCGATIESAVASNLANTMSFAQPAMKPSPTVENAISKMLKMFQSQCVKEQSGIIRGQYASDAFFVDPLMKVHGHRDISLEFYSLIKMFNTLVTPKETTVTTTDRPSVVKATIQNHQTYDFKRESWLARKTLPDKVELDCTTILHVDESTGLILSHEEIWHNKKVPIPGFMKPFNGRATALFMRFLGWGKDVAPPHDGKAAQQ